MGTLDGRVTIITGAGRGIGREHALLYAAEGAKVVVNDLGGSADGSGSDRSAAQEVADEIIAMGGEAIANGDNVADWEGAQRLVNSAIEAFGDLHVLVNNAGILRDRVLINMTESEWDAVVEVHLKGHFAPTRWAAAYWREQTKAGRTVNASVINTSSTSGLFSNPGQTNYGAAKSGIATFSQIIAKELTRYGVRSNAIAPAARTRLTLSTPGLGERIAAPEQPDKFDEWDPANISPLVAYLGTADCAFNGATFFVQGGQVTLFKSWELGEGINQDARWEVADLADALRPLADLPYAKAPGSPGA
jgi:NAD(P)-dependent dehydrogenase (short-subunit alcohol dehydrogenase family)